jgi:cytochrome c2
MSIINLANDAFSFWWPGTTLVIIVFVYQLIKLWSGDTTYKKHLSQTSVALFAYTAFCLAVTLAKQHVLESSHLLALALTALAATSFLTAAYFERLRIVFRTAGIILAVSAATTSYANWLPQTKGGYPPPEVKLDVNSMTPQQLADEGEKIIFGGIGRSEEQGAVGKGQCTLCHTFYPEMPGERAPNLWGITARKRLHDTSIEYIAESHVCPSCYVVGGFGVRGTENRESPMPAIHKPPISLSIDELIAVDTWLFWHEGEIPPSPDEIRTVYEKLIPPDERPRGPLEEKPTDQPTFLLADGSEPVDQILAKAQCVACHTIPGVPGARGTIGPKLTMKTEARDRLKDRNYRGKAKTVREYITESILYPSVYVTKGYPDNTMPKVFGSKLNGLAIDKMVDYLAEVEEGKVPPPIK